MKWAVDGICMVPMQAKATVEADTAEQAIKKAQAMFKSNPRALVVGGSEDEGSAWDWRPDAVKIE